METEHGDERGKGARPRMLHATALGFDPTWRIQRHTHPRYHEMIVLFAGELEVDIGGEVMVGRAGDVLHYAAGEAHTERNIGGDRVEMVCVAWTGEATGWPVVRPDTRGRVRYLARWLTEYFPSRGAEDVEAANTLLAAMVIERGRDETGKAQGMARQVQGHVREHLGQKHTVESMARVAGMSAFHFARQFKAQTGETPMAFVRRTRVEAARGLIMSSRMPLKAVAQRVGFPDEFQLSRVYRRVTGHAPGRERMKEG